MLLCQGKIDEATELFTKAIAIKRKVYGKGGVAVANSEFGLGALLFKQVIQANASCVFVLPGFHLVWCSAFWFALFLYACHAGQE